MACEVSYPVTAARPRPILTDFRLALHNWLFSKNGSDYSIVFSAVKPAEKNAEDYKRLGEILVELGCISEEQLTQALEVQSRESY